MLPSEDKLTELGIRFHFYADDTVPFFVFGLAFSQCMFDDILTSIQRCFSNAKLKLNAAMSEYMIIRKCKIVEHGLLRLPQDGDYTEQLKLQVVLLIVNLFCSDKSTSFFQIHFIISVKSGQFVTKLKYQS